MSRMVMDVDLDGWELVKARLRGMQARARDASPAWDALLDWWARANVLHFHSRGVRWLGRPWVPLKPSTVRQKAAQGYWLAPLIRTRRLITDLTVRPLGLERISAKAVHGGTSHRAAYFHQVGTRHMPRRQLVDVAAVRASGAPTDAIRNWIVDGRASSTELGR